MARHTIPRSCLTCGETFMVRPIIVAYGEGKYCSYACNGAHRVTHGEAGAMPSPEYSAWTRMKNRCLNTADPAYPSYGGRGIGISDVWRDNFEAFLADVGRRPSPKHSLDRYPDNNGGYEPGNTRWATMAEQSRNKRNNRPITYCGETRLISEWAAHLGIDRGTLDSRLRTGWSVARALTTTAKEHVRLEGHPRARLNVTAVQHIRSCDLTSAALGKIYGVGEAAIWKVRHGKTWTSC